MTSSARFALAALALSCATALSAPTAHALSAKECHASFAAARTAGTLDGQSYKQFKAAKCDAAATPATTAATPAETAKEAAPAAPATAPTAASTAAPAAAATTAGVVFPSAVAPQYAKLSAGKARMKTCLDQYNANKASTGNGSLKWIQKGGGYYSQCNTHLKAG
ncbi:hypothetical protein [Acetobacter cerevisiae]|uniref:hypothetical protein n=1 Tax=Acetobacter cerevisiae TaxID=178900 RepID=UPI00209E48B7|nr:hypothetical protein [Acetobacter cerevisiae]MCP1270742.1 hypothetical protein [Acetobacter cerevisiae]MCP1278734.1 hypothetical protein [Acetobacter cerevisiae]